MGRNPSLPSAPTVSIKYLPTKPEEFARPFGCRGLLELSSSRADSQALGEISKAINAINGTDAKKLYDALLKEARKRTAIADAQLDEEGKTLKKQDETEDLKNDEGVVMIESRAGTHGMASF